LGSIFETTHAMSQIQLHSQAEFDETLASSSRARLGAHQQAFKK
jgi:hypothetical protein